MCLQLPPQEKVVHVNLLVVGASGLGKTTFIRHVFEDYQSEGFQPNDGSVTCMEDFQKDPARFCTHLEESVGSDNDEFKVFYHVQDTPGEHKALSLLAWTVPASISAKSPTPPSPSPPPPPPGEGVFLALPPVQGSALESIHSICSTCYMMLSCRSLANAKHQAGQLTSTRVATSCVPLLILSSQSSSSLMGCCSAHSTTNRTIWPD